MPLNQTLSCHGWILSTLAQSLGNVKKAMTDIVLSKFITRFYCSMITVTSLGVKFVSDTCAFGSIFPSFPIDAQKVPKSVIVIDKFCQHHTPKSQTGSMPRCELEGSMSFLHFGREKSVYLSRGYKHTSLSRLQGQSRKRDIGIIDGSSGISIFADHITFWK